MTLSNIPTAEAYQELWDQWNTDDQDPAEGLTSSLQHFMGLDGGAVMDRSPAGVKALEKVANSLKLLVFRTLVNLYASGGEDRYAKLISELMAPSMRQFNLATRIERAKQGKEAANKKYSDKNWFGAMYTYTVAWGCIVPYNQAMVEDQKLQNKLRTIEYQLWANIIAMVAHSIGSNTVKGKDREKLYTAAIKAGLVLLPMSSWMTAGVITKTNRRLHDIHEASLTEFKRSDMRQAELDLWSTMESQVKGVKADVLFKDVVKGGSGGSGGVDQTGKGAGSSEKGQAGGAGNGNGKGEGKVGVLGKTGDGKGETKSTAKGKTSGVK